MRRSVYARRMQEQADWRSTIGARYAERIEEANETIRELKTERDQWRDETWRAITGLTEVNMTVGPLYASRLSNLEADFRTHTERIRDLAMTQAEGARLLDTLAKATLVPDPDGEQGA